MADYAVVDCQRFGAVDLNSGRGVAITLEVQAAQTDCIVCTGIDRDAKAIERNHDGRFKAATVRDADCPVGK